jgi:Transposase DDE domain
MRMPSIKLIPRHEVTDGAVHDGQKLDELLTKGNTSADVFGDSAYRSSEIEERLRAGGSKSRIHLRATGKRSLSEAQANANHNRSKIRVRVEHVFAGTIDRARRPEPTHDRHPASARQNWLAGFGLQHLPPCDAGADRRRITASGKHTRRADKRAVRWRQSQATNYRSALVSCYHASNRHRSRCP